MNTNVKSAHFLSNAAREVMVAQGQGGAIIHVSSVGGFLASDVIGGYSVSKAALIMLTQVQAKNWGTDGIRVNCIAPGLIKTEFSRALSGATIPTQFIAGGNVIVRGRGSRD